jgi:choline kinase
MESTCIAVRYLAPRHISTRFPLACNPVFIGGKLSLAPAHRIHRAFSTQKLIPSRLFYGKKLGLRSFDQGIAQWSRWVSNGANLNQYRAFMSHKPITQPTSEAKFTMPSLDDQSSAKHDGAQDQSRSEFDHHGLINQVYEWLHHEKTRRQNRKARKSEATSHATPESDAPAEDGPIERPSSNSSPESSFSLDKLEKILLQYATHRPGSEHGSAQRHPVKKQSRRRLRGLRRGSASESELTDAESAPPPGVEAYLDNTKTLAYSGGASVEENLDSSASVKQSKEADAWVTFKTEIVRLVHTLQLKGWRKVPADLAANIEVVRLSGALTNAVYVVEPPKNLPPPKTDSNTLVSRKPPP